MSSKGRAAQERDGPDESLRATAIELRAMTIGDEITPGDVRALREFLHNTPDCRRTIRREYFQGAAMGPILGLICLALARVYEPSLAAFAFGFPCLAYLAVWHFYYRSALAGATQKLITTQWKAALGRHILTLVPTGVQETRPQGKVMHLWTAVDAIHAAAAHFFISVGPDGHYAVPRNAFSDESEAAAFRETALRLWKGYGAEQADGADKALL